MKEILINLKRFDVPRELGGICPFSNPQEWIESTLKETINYGLGKANDLHLTYFLPEALILSAINVFKKYPKKGTVGIDIGCQGVFREDIKKGGNFGAFTTNLPATAAKNLGYTATFREKSHTKCFSLVFIWLFRDGLLCRKWVFYS
ncbi:unnamed protein product, partial [marine sediment metagenome]